MVTSAAYLDGVQTASGTGALLRIIRKILPGCFLLLDPLLVRKIILITGLAFVPRLLMSIAGSEATSCAGHDRLGISTVVDLT